MKTLPCGRKAPLQKPGLTEKRLSAWKERLKSHLAKENLRYTEQRWKLAQMILSTTSGHLTAQELINQVHKKHPGIGPATVYRNLKVLCDAGVLKESLNDAEGRVIYELYDEDHHDHIVCMDCGEIFEFTNERIEDEQSRITDKLHFSEVRHRHVIYGRCQFQTKTGAAK
jgi:Fur family ferric uptake transcriptional regulator